MNSPDTGVTSEAGDGRRDRRHARRGTPAGGPTRLLLVEMILGTFAEMPGLSVYAADAARLFGLRQGACRVVLDDLITAGRLRCLPDGRYMRP